MDKEKHMELYAKPWIDSYSGIDEHETSFEMLDNIAFKLVRIEITILNYLKK